ncbi:hypothetical protein GCM10009679_70130 [Saccharothrix algeriensis]|uniref:DUF881 domain-containing protein n=1 Tax=Catellatospora bangladeshensis TaxID=310355 RepID=A0A8J3JVW6_9ACTN|nr:hypothetical protein Cba03nite_74490 [Catellatospora bangladeshensis]
MVTDENKAGSGPDEPTVPLGGARPGDAADPAAAREPEPVDAAEPADEPVAADGRTEAAADEPAEPAASGSRWRVSGAGAVIGVLLVLLGFTLAVQLKNNSTNDAYATMRQEDLVTILADLDAREDRLQQDITELENSRRELASGASSRDQILKEAQERADDLGILAGTLKATGTGITLRFSDGTKPITAAHLLNAIQELRGAGAEAMQVDGNGGSVRVVASTHFVDSPNGGIEVDGVRLTGPYTITAIGPDDIDVAMKFRGGVVNDVEGDGGNVIVSKPQPVEITTVLPNAPTLEYAKPVS